MMKRIRNGLTIKIIALLLIIVATYRMCHHIVYHHYKYTIKTLTATYCCDSIEKYPNNIIGFHNSNGTFIQIK